MDKTTKNVLIGIGLYLVAKKTGVLESVGIGATKYDKYQYSDLYGFDGTIDMLKKDGFKTVGFNEKSIPSEGTRAFKINQLSKKAKGLKVIKVVRHKNGSATVKTKAGNFRFWK